MELTNKRESYTVSTSSANLKITGDITLAGTNVVSFNGSFSLADNSPAGNFNYSESELDCNINIYGCPKANKDEAFKLIDIAIEEIKTKLAI